MSNAAAIGSAEADEALGAAGKSEGGAVGGSLAQPKAAQSAAHADAAAGEGPLSASPSSSYIGAWRSILWHGAESLASHSAS